MITGATGGLGSALAIECARRGYDLLLTDLTAGGDDFAAHLSKAFGIEVRYKVCDLTSHPSRTEFFESLKAEKYTFWGLINVAGMDYEGAFLERTREQILYICKLNVEAILDFTHAILKLRDPRQRFVLINVCSLAAFFPMPYKATYAATKRFLLDFSLALREEIHSFGTVTALCPAGLPTTPETMRKIFAQGLWGKLTTMDTAFVARRTIELALRGKAVFIPGVLNGLLHWVGSLVPAEWAAKAVSRRWRPSLEDDFTFAMIPRDYDKARQANPM